MPQFPLADQTVPQARPLPDADKPELHKPWPTDSRQTTLVRAAYDLIVARGLEGLRTRDIAAGAGVNVATLHYYFPTKEALIGGVAEFLCTQFMGVHGAPQVDGQSPGGQGPSGPSPSGPSPDGQCPALDRLRQEFADSRLYQGERRDMITVMQELILRARRDEAVNAIVAPLLEHWRLGIQQVIAAGVAEGVFRRDIDPRVASTMVIAALSGVIMLGLAPPALDDAIAGLERYLLVSPDAGPTHAGRAEP